MKKVLFGLLLVFGFLFVLPTQAHQMDVKQKIEIVKNDVSNSIINVDYYLEVPQVLFKDSFVYKDVDKRNFKNENFYVFKNNCFRYKNNLFEWRFLNLNYTPLTTLKNKPLKFLHVDPCRNS